MFTLFFVGIRTIPVVQDLVADAGELVTGRIIVSQLASSRYEISALLLAARTVLWVQLLDLEDLLARRVIVRITVFAVIIVIMLTVILHAFIWAICIWELFLDWNFTSFYLLLLVEIDRRLRFKYRSFIDIFRFSCSCTAGPKRNTPAKLPTLVGAAWCSPADLPSRVVRVRIADNYFFLLLYGLALWLLLNNRRLPPYGWPLNGGRLRGYFLFLL